MQRGIYHLIIDEIINQNPFKIKSKINKVNAVIDILTCSSSSITIYEKAYIYDFCVVDI
jgi:hypothetical protein